MTTVKLTCGYNDPLIRQTPGGSGVWEDFRFHINDDCTECDYWVVLDKARHRKRRQLAFALKEHFGSTLDLFGFGHAPIADKWDAFIPYRYHVAIENCSLRDYWTEKLADSFLGKAMPIYDGCLNLGDYFPASSFRTISRDGIPGAIDTISRLLAEDPYDQALSAIEESRRLVLDHYNLFPALARLLPSLPDEDPRQLTLRAEGAARSLFHQLVGHS